MGFVSHARQAKNGRHITRFPKLQLGKAPRKLQLPEQVTQAGAWVTAYFSFCDYDLAPARTLGFGKLKHLPNQDIF